MDLRQLRYFVAVAEEASFSRAAARIPISQPPLSRQIAKLEQEIGVRLLQRTQQGVTLTEPGRLFLEEARKTLASAAAALGTAKRAAGGQIGRLTLGFGGSAAYTFLPTVLRIFRKQHPGVQLALINLPMTAQLDAIVDGRIDIGMLMLPVRHKAIVTALLVRDPLVVALPSGHPLAKRRSVRLAQLAPFEQILFTRTGGLGFFNQVMELCRRAGFVPRLAGETAPMESVIGLVAAGVGIAIVPAMAQKLRIAEVVYRRIEDSYASVDFVMAWRGDNGSPALAALLSIARSILKKKALGAVDRSGASAPGRSG